MPTHAPTMRAVVQSRYGAPEDVLTISTTPRPEPEPGQVLVRMRASSVNTPDWLTVTGVPYVLRLKSGLRGPGTPVRGSDVAGVVEAVGEGVTALAPGDEVFGSLWNGNLAVKHGAFAEYTVAPASAFVPKPAGVTFEEAAASVMSGLTALTAMRDVGGVGEGTRVLINGASGGVGTFAVQIAKHLGGHVTAVCGPKNTDFVRSLGADDTIDYTATDFTRGSGKYDVILDNVLNHPPSRTAKALAPGGRLLPNSVGDTGNAVLAGLPRIARASLIGMGRTDVRPVHTGMGRDHLAAVAELLGTGAVKAVVDGVYPLDETPAAVARMLTHRARGNVVITM
ncbi:NAD(P)-dependent alcohol dehydrogenase [Phytomonospora endophytica]|uniref:NADPH:quinone reductase-like Zn-dependent oxidoreductase n=1 Tax=Phytomonospora endophytica TaxID=714109 RepID=A0A841FH20_9ACTN|nr:NAD(P)-dependent alcohol dehydrogenase [Phytomonospora endophytica]MBB6034293.1 NADPH:quinone reductase-like Zn-dependent oxidoreductase [Phytomonospora endophytica]GIG66687.1 NADPH:quinone reductase [Phytomonospora endophytica]